MNRPSPRSQILLELPGEALCRHLKSFVLHPFDIDNRLTRRTDDTDTPRSECDAVRSEVEMHENRVGARAASWAYRVSSS